ncbi:hypothetical protein BJ322DRAFT_1022247 [Thelephora terrestris]|uniref:Uncharacterized protein n=1 Tax=Thelephora terrestris TaxID=56493 RepID=A0A9P6HC27_9AGAM|nr:hypothetical protein BJ322DRAFT_1022247 [Thelephora terrestris]
MSDESDSGDERNDRYWHQDEKRRGLPKYGRDPQTSAGATGARVQSWNNFANDKGRSHLIDSKPVGTCEKGSDHPEDEVRKKINVNLGIKSEGVAYLENLAPLKSTAPDVAKTESTTYGLLQTLLTPPSEPSPPRLGRTIELPVPDNVPTMEEVMDVNVPPLGQRSPGLLAAAHFEKLTDPTLGRAEDSFFAFGAIIVGGGVEQPPYVYQGAAYIHLYGPELDASSNRPTPPPLRRVLGAPSAIFSPWVMGRAMVTNSHGSWGVQRCTTVWVPYAGLPKGIDFPWVMGCTTLLILHGSWLYNAINSPWVMGCTRVSHGSWVVQWYRFSMGHGSYNTINSPWVMGCTRAWVVQGCLFSLGHGTYAYSRKGHQS